MPERQKILPDDVFRATVCRPNSVARKAERLPRPLSLEEESNRKLCNAVIERKLDKLRSLLEDAGLDVNARDKAGNTAGHQAATDAGADEMSILISHGLDIDAANKDGNTALHQALMHGNIEVTQCLMTAFPNEGLRNRSGFTALGEANRAGQTRSINHIRDFIEQEKADLLREHCDLERRRLLKLHRKKEILYGRGLELMPHDSDFRCLGSWITASDKASISLSLQATAIARRIITAGLQTAVLHSTEGRPREKNGV